MNVNVAHRVIALAMFLASEGCISNFSELSCLEGAAQLPQRLRQCLYSKCYVETEEKERLDLGAYRRGTVLGQFVTLEEGDVKESQ
jgi:hypothetical protein